MTSKTDQDRVLIFDTTISLGYLRLKIDDLETLFEDCLIYHGIFKS